MQVISRIPELSDSSFSAAHKWFAAMQEVELLFHPDDDPQDIVLPATDKSVFTAAEVTKLRSIMAQLFDYHGDGVYEACYPVVMEACARATS